MKQVLIKIEDITNMGRMRGNRKGCTTAAFPEKISSTHTYLIGSGVFSGDSI
jgi:hypothetical protein